MKHILAIGLGSHHCQCYKSEDNGECSELTNQHKDPSFLYIVYGWLCNGIEMLFRFNPDQV